MPKRGRAIPKWKQARDDRRAEKALNASKQVAEISGMHYQGTRCGLSKRELAAIAERVKCGLRPAIGHARSY